MAQFLDEFWKASAEFDIVFDLGSAEAGGADEYFKRLGALAKKLQTNTLSPADAAKLDDAFQKVAKYYHGIMSMLSKIPRESLTPDDSRLMAFFK
jgi:hypothetical protein